MISYIIGMFLCGQEFSSEIIEKIKEFIGKRPDVSRTKLSLQVCEWLNWRSENGKYKDMSCRTALLKLEKEGFIKLPAGGKRPPKAKSDVAANDPAINPIQEIRCDLRDLGKIEVVPVQNRRSVESRVWNSLMKTFHYLGNGPLCGAQIRYLIVSERYGYLGGLSFSAAAWKLEARDDYILWDEESRKSNLDSVVCNSRFLIHPQVNVKNLASHSLSLCISRLSKDWYERYGISPILLETFVDQERFEGTCYRAANWIHIGQTKGRGRKDVFNRNDKSIKDVYVYPVRKNFQEILCDGNPRPLPKPREPVDWADEEFGCAELGDQRKLNRLLMIARDFYANPKANVPQACGSRAKTKAAYRFFDDKKNTMDKILSPHFKSALNRIQKERIVFAVQDTTVLNYSAHPATENLGPTNNKEDTLIGLIVHDTMAFSLAGTPLGLMDVQCWARPEEARDKTKNKKLPIDEKESSKWLKSYHAQAEFQKRCPDTKIVNVSDRESDIYEFFELASREPNGPDILVRAKNNRSISGQQKRLWDYVAKQKLAGIREIQVPRKKNQKARKANVEIRFSEVTLNPPCHKPAMKPLKIWALLAEEIDPPEGVEALNWKLLTTCPINNFENACEKMDWYCIRWGIEIYHRTLKSGCKIEERQLGHAERIETCLAIDMVVAWRIYHLAKLGRETPDVPCTVFFEDAEWKALVAYKTQNATPPKNPPTLRNAMRMVASLGGFLGRKSDGEPGTKTLWLGLQRLDDLTEMWKIAISTFAPHFANPPPVASNSYG